jgi:cytochrome b subunit of formate dehydrogenase
VGFLVAAGPAGAAITGLSQTVRRDDEFCLGCHGPTSHDKKAPRLDPVTMRESAHATVSCVRCHRDIDAVPHRLPVHEAECISCHSEGERQQLVAPDGTSFFGDSRHGVARLKGIAKLPECSDCHGTHDVEPITDRAPIVDRCITCHTEIGAEYRASVHGKAFASGVADAPTCQTCHHEHPHGVEKRFVQPGVVATCVSCHEDPGLQQRYSLPANRLASYLGSFHGAASELGDTRAANCASCHGRHLILPSSDPRSTVNPANLRHTCGACHPNASQHFAQARIHVQPTLADSRLLFFVKIGYQLFVLGLISSFLGYIALDVLARLRGRMKEHSPRPEPGEWEPQFERLTLHQRLQHWTLILSFVTLLITGLPLSSPGSAISRRVVGFLGGMGARAVVHRTAAVVLICLVAYHVLYVIFSRRGNRELRQLIPGFKDAHDIIQMMKFYFGLTPIRPSFGRYNYIEKFEYLAVGWGSVIMITTGALLWAPHLSLLLFPKWVMDVALIVHNWEAILAFLAIIVWHMYNVHWNPSVFPMSRVWLTGKIGLHEFRENHPLEYEARRGVPVHQEAED